MRIIFNTKQIPALQALSLEQRFQQIAKATNRMTGPEKLLLNVIKLLIIVPAFVFLLRVTQDWTSLIWAFVILLAYPLVLRPVQLTLIQKYLKEPSAQEN